MGIFINGVDISKLPFGARQAGKVTLGEIFRMGNEPVDPGRYATDADFKVWAITGGRPVVSGSTCENATDDENKEW